MNTGKKVLIADQIKPAAEGCVVHVQPNLCLAHGPQTPPHTANHKTWPEMLLKASKIILKLLLCGCVRVPWCHWMTPKVVQLIHV